MASVPAASPSSSTPVSLSSGARPDLGRVGLFLAIALAVTAGLSLPVALGVLPAAMLGVVVPIAQLSPLVAALIARRRGEPWWRSLALSVPSWRLLAVAALGGAAAFTLVPFARVLIGVVAGAPLAADATSLSALLLAVPMVLVMQAVFAIGEEAGWRGWLHTRLAPWGFWRSSLAIGAMWALWHLPIVLALGLSPREAVTYLGTILAVAPLLGALREISGTAWAAVLGHGLLNSARVAIEQNVLGPLDPSTAWLLDLVSWALWIIVAGMVLRVGTALAPGAPVVGAAQRGTALPLRSRDA